MHFVRIVKINLVDFLKISKRLFLLFEVKSLLLYYIPFFSFYTVSVNNMLTQKFNRRKNDIVAYFIDTLIVCAENCTNPFTED